VASSRRSWRPPLHAPNARRMYRYSDISINLLARHHLTAITLPAFVAAIVKLRIRVQV